MKRAFLLITDADYVFVTEARTDRTMQETRVEPSEQLLSDLWLAVDALLYAGGDEGYPMVVDPEGCRAAAASVRALLPKEDS